MNEEKRCSCAQPAESFKILIRNDKIIKRVHDIFQIVSSSTSNVKFLVNTDEDESFLGV